MNRKSQSTSKQFGFTLTELLIALVLGLLVASAASVIFLQSKRNFLQNEQVSRVQENGRYALKILVRDISMAGFMGEHIDTSTIANSATVLNDCGAAGWFGDFTTPLELINANANDPDDSTDDDVTNTFGCISASGPDNYLDGTDAIATKRVADAYVGRIVPPDATNDSCTVAPSTTPALNCTLDDRCCIESDCTIPAACLPKQNITYLQTNRSNGFIYHRGAAPPVGQLPALREDWRLLTRVYFIRPESWTGNNIPTLCRMTFNNEAAMAMEMECLAEGIENMQIELGVDSSGDGVPDYYVANPSPTETQQAVVARIFLLVRGTNDLNSVNNTKTYALGSTNVGPFNDGFSRRVFSTNVQLRNFSN